RTSASKQPITAVTQTRPPYAFLGCLFLIAMNTAKVRHCYAAAAFSGRLVVTVIWARLQRGPTDRLSLRYSYAQSAWPVRTSLAFCPGDEFC
ncbi:hypothetical protein BaRGS_00008090, partial [Batillaria attramentaria]